MNNKQLAEMIKNLHREKLEELRAITPIHVSTKGKTEKRQAVIKAGGQQNVKDGLRYRTEENSSNTKSTIINTTPEQDSAMVGTQ
jgi:hypothetical protein